MSPVSHNTGNENEITIHTKIDRVGVARIDSPLTFSNFVDDTPYPFFLDNEFLGGLNSKPRKLSFELAGPRKKIYFDPPKTRCAIVTCGGLCPGINDVIRSIVMEAAHGYGVAGVLGIRYGLQGFIPKYKHEVVELTPDSVSQIHQFGGTVLGSSRGPQNPEEVVDALERLNVSCLFMIGGDGTLKAANAVSQEAQRRGMRLSVIGVPKTIDNDINFISRSFGFETAVQKASEAIQCAHTEALGSPCGIGIVKLMGRESGFIAAHATISIKEANFVLIPETRFSLHGKGGLLPALEDRLRKRGHAVIVVAEGAGQHLMQETAGTDASGNPILADISHYLIEEIKSYFSKIEMKVTLKYIDPSYIIRSVPANADDRVYCGLLGQSAVHAAMAGKTEMVVAKLMDRYVHLPLSLVTARRKKLNIASSYWRSVLESTGQQATLSGMLPGDFYSDEKTE
ncbi:MAG: ATP-dependent 6-phosphofructokinase [Desulfovibrionaceae bacterium]|nr:ATP-dependent 6-phosphofructokinase [Desulfovibrionaceae bacterium]